MASGLYVVQRLDLYNREQIDQGKNGDVFVDTSGYAKIIRGWDALSDSEKSALRAGVSDTTRRYGEKEFTRSVIHVYQRAVYEYSMKIK